MDLHEYLEHRLSVVQSGKVQEGLDRISSLKEVIDLHAKRVMYGLRTRVPPDFWGAFLVGFSLSQTG
jgi:hypothetical protein